MEYRLPDFLIKPRELIEDENIKPLDGDVYGIIYWCTKMSLQRCLLKNKQFAKMLHCTEGSIENALTRLVKYGYVESSYDRTSHTRELFALIFFARAPHQMMGSTPSNDGVAPHQMMGENSLNLATPNRTNGNNINNTVNGCKTIIKKLPDVAIPKEQRDFIKDEILKALGDDQSEKFYKLVASKVPEVIIRTTLAEVREAGVENPARLFTHKTQKWALTYQQANGLNKQIHFS